MFLKCSKPYNAEILIILMTVKNSGVTPIRSLSELDLPPIRTGLGSVDLVIQVSAYTNVTNLNLGGIVRSIIGPAILCWSYEAQSGLLVSGDCIDDILTQRFGVPYFKNMEKTGEVVYWMYLEDHNVEGGRGLHPNIRSETTHGNT